MSSLDISRLVDNGTGGQIELSWRWRSSNIQTVYIAAYNIINNALVFSKEVSFQTYSQLASRQQGISLPRSINHPVLIELRYGSSENDKLTLTVSKNKLRFSYSIKEKTSLFNKQKKVTLIVNNHTSFIFTNPIIKYNIVSESGGKTNQFGFLPSLNPDINIYQDFLLDKDKHITLQCNDYYIQPKWVEITRDGGR